MNEIRNIGIPFPRVQPAGRKERVSERSSEPVTASSDPLESVTDRRRNPDRRRRNSAKPGFERRVSSDRRRPRIDIDV